MKHTLEDVLKTAAQESFSLTNDQAEKLLAQSPKKIQIGNYSVYWDDDTGELIILFNPKPKPTLKPLDIPYKDSLAAKLKKAKRDINNIGFPSSKPPKP